MEEESEDERDALGETLDDDDMASSVICGDDDEAMSFLGLPLTLFTLLLLLLLFSSVFPPSTSFASFYSYQNQEEEQKKHCREEEATTTTKKQKRTHCFYETAVESHVTVESRHVLEAFAAYLALFRLRLFKTATTTNITYTFV